MATIDWGYGWIVGEGDNNYHIGLVREALSALGEGVRRCAKRIDEADASGHAEYADAVTDEECDVIETLLGSAFTVCQTHIAKVVSDVKTLHRLAGKGSKGKSGVRLTTTNGEKTDIMRLGCTQVGSSGVSLVQALDALANYFKHREEWIGDWASLSGHAAKTAPTITLLGLQKGSTGNLRRGAKLLGNTGFDNMNAFANILEEWHKEVMAMYEKELRKHGLM